jgi:hypothetical protein
MPVLEGLRNRAVDVSPVKAPAMNITLGSAGVLSLAAVLTVWKDAFEFLFGADARPGIRAAILIATIAAIVLIASSDMFARAIATRQDPWHVVPWAKGWTATIIGPGEDETGFIVAGMRVRASSPEDVEYLLAKEGEATRWEGAEVVRLKPPATT